MKKIIFLFSLLIVLMAKSQHIVVNNSGNIMYTKSTSEITDITFDSNYTRFNNNPTSTNLTIQKAFIDSFTFATTAPVLNKIYIIYNGTDNATIINPYSTQGVNITANGGTVTVTATSGIPNLEYNLLGTSTTASLTMSSDQPAHFILNNLNITNPAGAAILLTGNKIHTFTTQANTNNTLTDSSTSTRNGTLQSDGKIILNGSGTLAVRGIKKHGIASTSQIEIQNGNINITGAASDGLHSEGFTMSNGNLTVTASSDAVDAGDAAISISGGIITSTLSSADVKGIKTGTSTLAITGGTINLTLSGAQSKAISAKGNITIDGGSITTNLSGAAVLSASGSGYDPSYSTAIKSDGNITINAGTLNLTLTSTATGGKGISADGEIIINGGTITVTTAGNGATYTNTTAVIDSYTAACLKSDTNIKLFAGNITLSSTGTGGKGASADGQVIIGNLGAANNLLVLNVSTSGNRFLVSGTGNNADYANPKAVKAEGNLTLNSGTVTINCTQTTDGGEGLESKATLTINGGKTEISTWDDAINAANAIIINGGVTYAYAKNNDGIDSNGTITINGGQTIANGSRTPEEGFDCDNNAFVITGGTIVGTGGATSNPTNGSTQKSIKITTTAGNHVQIKNSAGTAILMYKVPVYYGNGNGNSVTLLFTSPLFTTGSYTITRGGTISGGTDNHGYISGGTYTGGSNTTINVSNYLTTVN